MRLARVIVLALGASLAAAPSLSAQQQVVFDFDLTPIGTTTPFTLSPVFDYAATFSSDGTFTVVDEFQQSSLGFQSLGGRVLLDADEPRHALLVTFASLIQAVSLDFALNAPAGSLTWETRAFGVPLAVTTVGGVIPTGFTYPEGHVDVSGGGLFNGVYITSTAPNFAIDDVRIVGEAPTAIPEPSTVAMLGFGVVLLGLAQSCRRIVRTTRS
jgi:hypothetical protein